MKPAAIAPYRLYVIGRETQNRIDHYMKLVAESQCVDEASNFARWLQGSGVLQLLAENPQPMPLPVDGVALKRTTERLVGECAAIYSKCGNTPPPEYRKTDIDDIREQLAAITKKLAA